MDFLSEREREQERDSDPRQAGATVHVFLTLLIITFFIEYFDPSLVFPLGKGNDSHGCQPQLGPPSTVPWDLIGFFTPGM